MHSTAVDDDSSSNSLHRAGQDSLGLPKDSHSVNTSELGLKHTKYFAAKLKRLPFYWPCGNLPYQITIKKDYPVSIKFL